MPTGTLEYREEAERVAIEQAIAFVTQTRGLACHAPPGLVLAACEGHALDAGRDLLRTTLQRAVQADLDATAGKTASTARARAGADAGSSGGAGATC
jgi:hypothetical protein